MPKSNIVKVKVLEIHPQNAPLVFEFVGQAQSSRQVEIRARVDGFLEQITYQEGSTVEEGQILFELDKRPYEAALQQAKGELALQEARHSTASSNLRRIRPLAAKDAVSQKDLDDAVGAEQAAAASVMSSEGNYMKAQLNLSYATISSPLKGLASKTEKQKGSYVPTGVESLLTYVAQLDPIWINFSISENQILNIKKQIAKDKIIPPKNDDYEVEAILGDGSIFPTRGKINFAEPNIDPSTGTFNFRAEIANKQGNLRPGQFLKVRLHGAIRPDAIMVPLNAVIQGSKGHFVWVLNEKGNAAVRDVTVGAWQDGNWNIEEGLSEDDRVVVDGISRLRINSPVEIISLIHKL